MTGTLRHLWAHHHLSMLGFVIAVLVMLFFTLRLALSAVYWSDPDHLRQPPERWMTPGYIARSWNLPPEDVASTLGLDPDIAARRQTLDEIATARGVSIESLIADLAAHLEERSP